MSWRHYPKLVELRGSSSELSVGDEFRRRRELRRQIQNQLEVDRRRWQRRSRRLREMEVIRG